MAVNDSSEIRTVGISISTREAGGGFAITGIFGPAVPLGSTIGMQGRFWKTGCPCPTGRPSAADPMPAGLSFLGK